MVAGDKTASGSLFQRIEVKKEAGEVDDEDTKEEG